MGFGMRKGPVAQWRVRGHCIKRMPESACPLLTFQWVGTNRKLAKQCMQDMWVYGLHGEGLVRASSRKTMNDISSIMWRAEGSTAYFPFMIWLWLFFNVGFVYLYFIWPKEGVYHTCYRLRPGLETSVSSEAVFIFNIHDKGTGHLELHGYVACWRW